jgi:hypothetical protein
MSLLDGSGNEIKSAADDAVRALDGPDFGPGVDSEPAADGAVEVAGTTDALPEFDFGAGELGEKVRKLKDTLVERNLLPVGSVPEGAEGAEQQPGTPQAQPDNDGPIQGSSIDWSEFDLDLNYAHFYPRATWTVTGEGPKWVVVIDEYLSAEKAYNASGVDKKGDPKNLGQFITSKINSPPDTGTGPWQVATVLPATMGNGAVLFTRKVPIVLPDPKPLVMETKVDAPTDTELKTTDDAATKWAAEGAAAGEEVVATAAEPTLAEQIAAEVIDGPDVAPEATA